MVLNDQMVLELVNFTLLQQDLVKEPITLLTSGYCVVRVRMIFNNEQKVDYEGEVLYRTEGSSLALGDKVKRTEITDLEHQVPVWLEKAGTGRFVTLADILPKLEALPLLSVEEAVDSLIATSDFLSAIERHRKVFLNEISIDVKQPEYRRLH